MNACRTAGRIYEKVDSPEAIQDRLAQLVDGFTIEHTDRHRQVERSDTLDLLAGALDQVRAPTGGDDISAGFGEP